MNRPTIINKKGAEISVRFDVDTYILTIMHEDEYIKLHLSRAQAINLFDELEDQINEDLKIKEQIKSFKKLRRK